MLETITAVNQAVNSFIWGIPAMVCIIGVGLLLSVRTGFLQLRKFIQRVHHAVHANPGITKSLILLRNMRKLTFFILNNWRQ